MADRYGQDFVGLEFIRQSVRIRRCEQSMNAFDIRHRSGERMAAQQFGQILQALLRPTTAARRLSRDIVERGFEVGQRIRRVTELPKPCFRQTAATSSSVANSRRAVWSSERASDAFSSGDKRTCSRSSCDKPRIRPASWSCLSGDHARAASSAGLSGSVVVASIPKYRRACYPMNRLAARQAPHYLDRDSPCICCYALSSSA